MSEKMIEIRGKQVSEDTVVEALQGHIDFEKKSEPKTVWITEEEVEREGKKSTLAAVEVSIKKYRQVYEASDKELLAKGGLIIYGSTCGLCHRFAKGYGNVNGCRDCLLFGMAGDNCCSEWRACKDTWGDWPSFRPAVLKMIERLEKERDKLLKPEPYVFKAGDVALDSYRNIRIIVEPRMSQSKLHSFDVFGYCQSDQGQQTFESCGYKKIGVLSDFIKKDC